MRRKVQMIIFIILIVLICVFLFLILPKIRVNAYFKEMGRCYAHMYLSLKDLESFKELSEEELMFATSLVILRHFVETKTISLKEIQRQVELGAAGLTDIAFAMPSQTNNRTLNDIIKYGFEEHEQLASVIKNILILKLNAENKRAATASDVQLILLQEATILKGIEDVFIMYKEKTLQKTIDFRKMKMDMEYLVNETDIQNWIRLCYFD